MSSENGRPWYRNPKYLGPIIAAIVGAIISNPLWVPVIFPPPPDFSISVNPMQGQVPQGGVCLLYTSPSPRDGLLSRMPSSA